MKVFVKDKFVDENKASISIQERGFRYGDGIFETIRIINSKPYRWDLHEKRFHQALQKIDINFNQNDIDTTYQKCIKLISINKVINGILRLSISRGIGSVGYLPTDSCKPTIIIETLPLTSHNNRQKLFVSNIKRINQNPLLVPGKLMQSLDLILAKMESAKHSYDDALMLNSKEHICETSSANIFWFRNNILHTPSISCGIINGVIRQVIIEKSLFIVKEGQYSLQDLEMADEIFITNVNIGIANIERINIFSKEFSISDKISALDPFKDAI